jgi:hypothetical protein
MTSGGARNRSGPPKDPNSATSDRIDFKLTSLPSAPRTGPVPEWPLMVRRVYRWEVEDKRRFQVLDEDSTEEIRDREAALWEWVWRTPQAYAWSLPSESWRLLTVAMWVRTFVICESSEATAADKNSLHRFADQIGMTTAGLAEMGWAVAKDELSAKRAEVQESTEPARQSSRNRMKVVGAE